MQLHDVILELCQKEDIPVPHILDACLAIIRSIHKLLPVEAKIQFIDKLREFVYVISND